VLGLLAGVEPPPVILAGGVLGLEVLGRLTRLAVAVPDAVDETTFQWDFLDVINATSSTSAASSATSKHCVGGCVSKDSRVSSCYKATKSSWFVLGFWRMFWLGPNMAYTKK